MRALLTLILGGFLVCGIGCSPVPNQSGWVRVQTVAAQGERAARAQAALAKLGQPGQRAVCVGVLDSDTAGAFSWPDGRLYATRALIDLLDDNELAAALAHEMGHLLNDGKLSTIASLRGCASGPDAEARADATGATLLRQCGVPAAAMVTMLRKVQGSPSVSPACKNALDVRIALLTEK